MIYEDRKRKKDQRTSVSQQISIHYCTKVISKFKNNEIKNDKRNGINDAKLKS